MTLFPCRKTLLQGSAILLLAGCAGQAAFREGKSLVDEGRIEEGLSQMDAAVKADPENPRYRLTYLQTWDRAVARFIDDAERLRREGKTQEAGHVYRRALALDPNNGRAKAGLEAMVRDEKHSELLEQAQAAWSKGDPQLALAALRAILAENPQHGEANGLRQVIQQATAPAMEAKLSARLAKPISIEFKDVSLKEVFEVISRTSGVNFVFDKDVQGEQKTTVFLRGSSVQEAINVVLLTNQLEQRILDKNSILVYPNTPAKARDYQQLMVKTFFLSNSDVKSAVNTLKTIVKSKELVSDERQNMLIIRDTPEAVRVAERLLALHDLPEPEVMLEVEILEVKRTRLLELGIRWPDQLILTPLASVASRGVTLNDLRRLDQNSVGAALAPMTVTARKQDGDVRILANPRIRTRSREPAKVLIGDRVPNITTTATATGFVSESIQYLDVGLKLEVEPVIFADNEIAIKLALEVSSIVNQFQTKSGSIAYQIGTRTTSTMLRLKDGENQVLAGLISDEERVAGNKMPGLGDIPLFGRLFGVQRDDNQNTEIILSITPRLIRNIQRPALVDVEFDTGTQANFGARALETAPAIPAAVPPEAAVKTKPQPGSSAPGAATLRWQGTNQAKQGELVTLDLLISSGQPITSLPHTIAYDPAVLEAVSVAEGDFLKSGGAATRFDSRIDQATGRIILTEARNGPEGATAAGTLARFTFRALKAGSETKVQITAAAPAGISGHSVPLTLPAPHTVSINE